MLDPVGHLFSNRAESPSYVSNWLQVPLTRGAELKEDSVSERPHTVELGIDFFAQPLNGSFGGSKRNL